MSVSVTARVDGYQPLAVRTWAAGRVRLGQATFRQSPRVLGAAQVGRMLLADPGTFAPSTATATYQWMRSGLPITGATKRGYILRPADVGHRVAVRVTVTAPHWAPARARARAETVTRSVPQITVRTTSHATSAGLGIRVVTPGLAGPDGTVRVYEGDTLRGTVAITDGHGYVRLAHLSRGTHHLVLRYQGPGPQVPASKRVAVTVG